MTRPDDKRTSAAHAAKAPTSGKSAETKPVAGKKPTNGKASAPGKASAAGKRAGAAQTRERRARLHRWLRYGIQLVFFIMAPALFSGAFNGAKYLFAQIGLGSAIEPTSFVVQLVAVLGFTIVFGRFFCGYACAFGTLGDYLYNAFEFLRAKTPLPRPRLPLVLVRVLSLLKYMVLALICILCFAGTWASYSGNSPWVAFAALLSGSIEGVGWIAFASLAFVVVLMILRERAFCQFLCPLGALFSLMPVLGISEFARTRTHCAKNCGRCHDACPVDIWPDADAPTHGECISCGRCADVCPMANVNMLALEKSAAKQERLDAEKAKAAAEAEKSAAAEESTAESPSPAAVSSKKAAAKQNSNTPAKRQARPVRKTRDKWLLFQGNSIGYVVAKALFLLLICWLVGAARYVPPFVEVFGFSPLPF